MTELDIDAQIDSETAIAGLENAARRYAAVFLGVATGDASQDDLQAARERLARAAGMYAAAQGWQPPGEELPAPSPQPPRGSPQRGRLGRGSSLR